MTSIEGERDLFGAANTATALAQQLPLPLVWSDRAAEGGFLIGESNEAAVRYILAPESWTLPVTLLTGPEGSGKSHLGRLFSARTGGSVVEYAGPHDDEAVFHAWNRALGDQLPMLVIGQDDALVAHIALPDLRTRLSSTPHVTIGQPDPKLAAALLERGLADRGLVVTPKLAEAIVRGLERSYRALHAAIAAIDTAAMASGRVIGERMAREVLIAARLVANDGATEATG